MKPVNNSDVLYVGLMTFALFLGAGNLIFPPELGQQAGDQLGWAMAGFLLTGVGLPLLGVVAAARMGGGLSRITQDLPPLLATLIGLVLYLSIGPLFAAPRTGLVAYEFSVMPLLGESAGDASQLIYTFGFFGLSLLAAMFPGRIVDSVGKLITPLLVLVLLLIGGGTLLFPQGEMSGAVSQMEQGAFGSGFLAGYQTLDALASLAFGIVIITALKGRGVHDEKALTGATIKAGIIAAAGLSMVYMALGFLGATSHGIAYGTDNGAQMISLYITGIFGDWGQWLLAATMTLACLSTSIGLVTACSEYFHEQFPRVSYRVFAVAMTLACVLVANVGLEQLIALTIPALLVIYPVCIGLIVLCLIRPSLANPRRTFAMTLTPMFIVGLIDGLSGTGLALFARAADAISVLPFSESGMGWLVPGLAALVLSEASVRIRQNSAAA
ncbi:branched-chain amino acid transport system II carrier protein [Marinobacter sp. JSM 1782161]|uniref:branched-chain amino acid transport system II carrier protein n=1 Tax=Marinobacter sp. JSM 1782161 TaxID=2685906 RepID=UPI00140221DF|nr:branched-chain amino acid transport system II carrier protein [Marinobacter sp. JSM 1782161]